VLRTVGALARQATSYLAAANIRSAHFSPIMMHAALVLPETTVGLFEASATQAWTGRREQCRRR
jgi:hypothetical protein